MTLKYLGLLLESILLVLDKLLCAIQTILRDVKYSNIDGFLYDTLLNNGEFPLHCGGYIEFFRQSKFLFYFNIKVDFCVNYLITIITMFNDF